MPGLNDELENIDMVMRQSEISSAATESVHSQSQSLGIFPTFGEFILMFPALMPLFLPGGLSGLMNDGDTGWHIRTGDWILDHHEVPRVDFFSFTKTGEPWYAWEWLSDVGMALAHSAWGPSGVALIGLGILCLTYYWLYNTSAARSGNPIIALCVTALAMTISWSHWLARPHLLTLLFIPIAMWAIEQFHCGRWKGLLILALLTVLWANIHGGFVIVLLLLGALSTGALIEALFPTPGTVPLEPLKKCGTYAIAAVVCGLASLVNPYGYKLHEHILHYLLDPVIRARTLEFMPPDLRSGRLITFFCLDFLAAGWLIRRRRYGEAILVVGTAFMAASSRRHVSLHAVVVTPFLCEALNAAARLGSKRIPLRVMREALIDLTESGREWLRIRPCALSFTMPGLLALAIVLGCAFRLTPRVNPEFGDGRFPVGAVNSLQAYADLRVFTNGNGGYVIYALFPRGRVFLDGRTDFYGASMIAVYDQIVEAQPGWESTLERYGTNTAIVRKGTPLLKAMKESGRWASTFEDDFFVVFRLALRSEASHPPAARKTYESPGS